MAGTTIERDLDIENGCLFVGTRYSWGLPAEPRAALMRHGQAGSSDSENGYGG